MAEQAVLSPPVPGMDQDELAEWFESLDDPARREGLEQVDRLLAALRERAGRNGSQAEARPVSAYVNTLPTAEQPAYPGDRTLERRIKHLIRWNAMAMVVRANREHHGLGGHISTYASAATLWEVAFNHFLHARDADHPGDVCYFQGHASPGVYARAYLEGRLTEQQLERFRRESLRETGLSSYPHPWLMPGFWQLPSVSMGLAPMMAVYQARFLRYLQHRGIADTSKARVWCFLGDGEMDEPESVGGLSLAGRDGLDNLTFVVNCNLQRLDAPVRGNGKIFQELESIYRGAGWNCIKVIWKSDWDSLLEADHRGLLRARTDEVVDGQYQKYAVESGAYIRDADRKSIVELAAELADLAEKARARKLSMEDMEGATFAISNRGGIGGTAFTPIVNFPQVAILGMSRARSELRMADGQPEARLLLPLSFSYDHRVIDGADAARFLVRLSAEFSDCFQLLIRT